MNYRYVTHELEYLLDNSDSEVVVFERGFAPVIDEIRSKLTKVREFVVIEDGTDHPTPWANDYDELVNEQFDATFSNGRTGDDLYFLYTGGTTGMPKGVMWRHEDIFFAALSSALGAPIASPEEISQRSLPVEFALPSLIIAPLMHGGSAMGNVQHALCWRSNRSLHRSRFRCA